MVSGRATAATTTAVEADLEARVQQHLRYSLGATWHHATPGLIAAAIALAVREPVIDRLIATSARQQAVDAKRVYYLSIEFLMGRALGNTLCNLGINELWTGAAARAGIALSDVLEAEPDAALGNGGLGRLAACFLDSMATLDLPGWGYGINYEFGLFQQRFDDGFQRERLERWGNTTSPWMIERPGDAVAVPIYGRIEHGKDSAGGVHPHWTDWSVIVGIPYDMPIVGYGGRTVNTLRLFAARASDDFDMHIVGEADYLRAVEQKIASETVSKVLHPIGATESCRELRLTQEYFLVACALRDIVRRFRIAHSSFDAFPDKVAVQLNDTHPALGVPELMRVLVDEVGMPWERAWPIVERTFGYTHHSLPPNTLEKVAVPLIEKLLPRHLQIIYEINARFLDRVAEVFPSDVDMPRRVSLIEEGPVRQLRTANLSVVGSHAVNGVSTTHSERLKTSLMPDLHALFPAKFHTKTHGVTPRRWLLGANPELSALITRAVGEGWPARLDELRRLDELAGDEEFQNAFRSVKEMKKTQLARTIAETTRVTVDPASLFDIQSKRVHECTRQLLNAMHIIDRYLAVADEGAELQSPRTFIFAGKAAPGDAIARLIVRLINGIADVVNADARVRDQMRVVFLPDYRVSLAEQIIPAADLSEQISTAGTEASGTGNMKFALNGALTIGTPDGANVEILQQVGEGNIYIFGLGVPDVERLRGDGYDPRVWYRGSGRIKAIVDAIESGRFSRGDTRLFAPIVSRLLDEGDEYLHLADFKAYAHCQARAERDFTDREDWTRRAIHNTARAGYFSSDRAVAEYARDIWNVEAV